MVSKHNTREGTSRTQSSHCVCGSVKGNYIICSWMRSSQRLQHSHKAHWQQKTSKQQLDENINHDVHSDTMTMAMSHERRNVSQCIHFATSWHIWRYQSAPKSLRVFEFNARIIVWLLCTHRKKPTTQRWLQQIAVITPCWIRGRRPRCSAYCGQSGQSWQALSLTLFRNNISFQARTTTTYSVYFMIELCIRHAPRTTLCLLNLNR